MKLTFATLCIAVCGMTASMAAQATMQFYSVNIPRQRLDEALINLAKQTGVQIARLSTAPDSQIVGPITGNMPLGRALEELLAKSGLTYRSVNDHMIAIVAVDTATPTSASPPVSQNAGTDRGSEAPIQVAQAYQVPPANPVGTTGERNSADSASNPQGLPEVVVTAQKARAEREQDVPSALAVLSASELEDHGAVQLADYAKEVPSMNVIGARGPGLGEIVLRGISTGSDHSSPVGLYLDDVPFTPSSPIALATNLAFDPDLADIDHIEVLMGPQSTLYGANTVGGLVKFVTKQPDLNSVEGNVSVTGSEVNGGGTGFGSRASVNLPIVADAVGLRLSAFYRNDPGFVDNESLASRNVNWDSVKGARFSLLVKINDQLQTTLSGLAQDIDQPNPNSVYLNPGTLKPSLGHLAYDSSVLQPSDSTYRSLSDTTTFIAPFVTVTNVASYAQFANVSTVDYSADVGAATLPVGDLINFVNTSSSERYTDELRFASAPGRIEWLLGGFYTYEKDDNLEIDNGLNADGTDLPSTSPYRNVYDGNFIPHFREEAGFGDLTLHITDQVQATGGVRYSANSQSVSWYSTGRFGSNNVPSYSVSDSATTYLGTVSYMPNRDTTVYARAASAYRPGGPNVLNDLEITGGAPASYQSDKLWNYEVGVKGSLWDRRIVYTLDGYHMVWSDIQLTSTIDGFIVVANGSGAKSDGAEGSLSVQPIDHLRVSLKGAYTNARFTAAAPALGAASGDPLPYSPKTTLAFLADYRFDGIGEVTPTAGLTYAYHGADDSAYSNDVTYHIPYYDTLDLRTGVDWGNYGVSLRALNVTNKFGLTSVATSNALNSPIAGTVIQPRTLQLALNARF